MTVHAFPVSTSGQPAANVRPVQLAPQFFPQYAEVLIYRPARSAMTSGKARTRAWRLRFERRTSSFIEPLMGWTGGDDTLVQVELSFPSAEAAIAYARRQGLRYNVQGLSQRKPDIRIAASATEAEYAAAAARRQRMEWVERTLGPDVIRDGYGPGRDPTSHYAGPQEVLSDPRLGNEEKRDLLRRWALGAYLLDLAFSSGASGADVSRLHEVIDALTDLERQSSAGSANGPQQEGRQTAA
jgi:hypothetical protein